MKNTYFILFVLIFCIKCDLVFTGEKEVVYSYKNSICIIDSDGKNLKTIKKDAWGDLFHFINEEEIIIVGNDTTVSWGPVYLVHLNINTSEWEVIYDLNYFDNLNGPANGWEVSPNGEYFVFSAWMENIDLFLFDRNGKNLKNLVSLPLSRERYPTFSKSGSKVLFITDNFNYDDSEKYINTVSYYDFETDSVVKVLESTDSTRNRFMRLISACFSDTDDKIYLVKQIDDNTGASNLYRYDISSKSFTLLDENVSFIGQLKISGTRNRIVYKTKNEDIAIIDTDGQNKTILDHEGLHKEFAISNDGNKVAIWDKYVEGNGAQFFVIKHDGSNKFELPNGKSGAFSENGNKIVFHRVKKITN